MPYAHHSNTQAHVGGHSRMSGLEHEHEHYTSMQPPKSAIGNGTWVAIIGYLCISFFSPLKIGLLLWRLLIFLVIPGLTGLVTGITRGGDLARYGLASDLGKLFRSGMNSALWPMACYTLLKLFIVHAQIGPSASPANTFLVEIGVTLAHGLLAGLVSGLFAILSAGFASRPEGSRS